jgi:hypothetical protein
MLDNTPPLANIEEVTHGASAVGECAIVNLGPAPDGLRFRFTARDNQGHLGGYALVALYGDNRSDPRGPIASDNYSHHISPSRMWPGVSSLTVPAAPGLWRAPVSCAYQFRLTVYDRTTNGYTANIHWAEYDKHLTILMAGPPLFPLPAPEVAPAVTPPGVPMRPGAGIGPGMLLPSLRVPMVSPLLLPNTAPVM